MQRRNRSLPLSKSAVVETITRFGYQVHGLIYMVIGGLAAGFAFGTGGQITDPPTLIETMRSGPMGTFTVLATALGMAAYGLWRLIQATADPDNQGTGIRGLSVRLGRTVTGIGYAGLGIFALEKLTHITPMRRALPQGIAPYLQSRWGTTLAVIVVLSLFIVALDDIRKAWTGNFGENLKVAKMSLFERLWCICAGRWGFASRAAILIAGAVFLMKATMNANPEEIKGLQGTLASFLQIPYGGHILGAVGLGVFFYGSFMVLAGRYRHHPS